MFTKPPLRIHTLVRQAIKELGPLNRLYVAIKEANAEAGSDCHITRPMLTSLNARSETARLTWNNIVALHVYFRTKGSSLQHLPILETRSVLEELVEAKRLVFMYGAKGRRKEQRTDLSWWDHKSFSELQMDTIRLGRRAACENVPVLWRVPAALKNIDAEDWYGIIEKDEASVVSIGSPLAALSSEIMLARMFGVTPFETPQFSAAQSLPFYFAWRPDLTKKFRSAFGLTSEQLKADFPDFANRNKASRSTAVVFDGKVHESLTASRNSKVYGIIAAQRRAAGHVWLVVSGLAGPATYGTATMVKQLVEELPWSAGTNSKVLWVPVKVTVTAGKARPDDGDVRKVERAEFDGDPRIWSNRSKPD